MTLIIKKPTANRLVLRQTYVGTDDPDAANYIAAVEAADGQPLETATRVAIHSFVKGCKADGIWPAIKASCILAGARTLSGALVPLAGMPPTNVNFTISDYDRKTGLKGNASNKQLNTNRLNSEDPQNSKHGAVYVTEYATSTTFGLYLGTISNTFYIGRDGSQQQASVNGGSLKTGSSATNGFWGVSRASSSGFSYRFTSVNGFFSALATSFSSSPIYAFSYNGGLYSNGRIAFYSIGESLDLALLDNRVTTLINDFAIAIP